MMGRRREFEFGAHAVKFLNWSLRDSRCGGLPVPVGEAQFSSCAARNFAPEFSNLRPPRRAQHRDKKKLVSFADVCIGSSSSWSRAFVVRPSRPRFTAGTHNVPNGCPQSNFRWFTEAARCCRPAVVGTGGIGVRQVAKSLGSGSIANVSLTKGNEVLDAVRFYGKCYLELSKARLSLFVVSTAAVGFVMGSGDVVNWSGLVWTSVGTMLASSSANAFNQILEVTSDGRMKRTMRRPLPAGRMSKFHALTFAVTAGIAGVTLLACKTSVVAAELGAANILLYTLVYTPLKQIHYVNTWVGAVVGAIPPLLGWAAATGHVDAGGWVLASALYFWQVPHFMAIAFLCRADYAAGGYKMLSLLDSSGQRTASCALRNCIYLLPLGFLAQHWGTTSGYFGAENLMLTIVIGTTAALFYLRPSTESARRLFRTSLLYLPILMTAMVVHRIPNPNLGLEPITANDAAVVREFHEYPHGVLGAPPTVNLEQKKRIQHRRSTDLPPPPISLISVAPFPFLPAPKSTF